MPNRPTVSLAGFLICANLAVAHSDSEQIVVKDIARAAEFLALYLLRQTGTI